MSEDDLTTPLGLFSFAHSYWEAAAALDNANRVSIHKDAPRDYLYYHSIELYLKSYLRLRGLSLRDIKKYSHRIEALHQAAIARGLTDDMENRRIISMIRQNYMRARYIETGRYVRPHPRALWGVCVVLHLEIEQLIIRSHGSIRSRDIPDLHEDREDDRAQR